ncbi:MAG: carbamoyltransferase [Candidatus Aureabacteria bacterium]|nr:carbamoyltransferase [Candidatus Auribacterota bacterium]
MNILGVSCFYHDSAAALVRDGDIVSAAQEERFSRKKHDSRFPKNALRFCLESQGLSISDIDIIAFYDKPFLKFERIIETHLAYAPRGLRPFLMSIPLWLKDKLWMRELIRKEIQKDFQGKILFTRHHEAHAASAFYPSPFERAAFLTLDGVGEWTTTSFGTGKGNDIHILYDIRFPHSLGLLYAAFTYYTGFKVNSGEYKVMGLAPYGEPKYAQKIFDELIDLKEDGSFKLNMKYFNYCSGLTMTSDAFHSLFGGPPRVPETKITSKEMDIAASIQKVTEEVMLRMARHVRKVTGEDNLCLAGGVSLNCVGNGKILKEKIFKKIWIQPASGDAGGALGAALAVWYRYLKNERIVSSSDTQKGSFLGPFFPLSEIEEFLKVKKAPYEILREEDVFSRVVDLMQKGYIIGWFSGKMEFGPRALGSRSILGDARNSEMQKKLNLKIKFRESFRPFAPSALKEKSSEWFYLDEESPYMLLVADVKKEKCFDVSEELNEKKGFEKLYVERSQIPAVTHVDFSARLQTVDSTRNPRYHRLIKSFYEATGCPVIINTSFNVRGEPIVCTPEDAYTCFMRTDMDYLILENCLLDKTRQPEWKEEHDWREEYELD